MKVVYLTLQETKEGQAAHAHVNEIVAGMRRRGADVSLFAVHYSDTPSQLKRLVTSLLTQLRAVPAVRRADVVYVRMHFMTAPIVWLATLFRRVVVMEVNGTLNDAYISYSALKPFRRAVQFCLRSQFKHIRMAYCVTTGLEDYVHEVWPSTQTSVMPNGANTVLFDPASGRARELDFDLPERFIVFFGALARWQGVSTMLAATREPAWPNDVKLVMVGDGPERPAIEAAIASVADPKVVYLGQLPYDVVPAVVSRSIGSLVVQQGAYEKSGLMPLKFYESLSCDVPVIVSNYPGMSDEVRKHDLGYVIEPGDVSVLAQRVADIDSAKHQFASGRHWVQEGNSWDARAGQILQAVESLSEPR